MLWPNKCKTNTSIYFLHWTHVTHCFTFLRQSLMRICSGRSAGSNLEWYPCTSCSSCFVRLCVQLCSEMGQKLLYVNFTPFCYQLFLTGTNEVEYTSGWKSRCLGWHHCQHTCFSSYAIRKPRLIILYFVFSYLLRWQTWSPSQPLFQTSWNTYQHLKNLLGSAKKTI